MEPQPAAAGKAAVTTCPKLLLLLHQAPMVVLGQLPWRIRRGTSWKWHARKLDRWHSGARLCHRGARAEAEAPPTKLPTCRRGEGGGSCSCCSIPSRTKICYWGVCSENLLFCLSHLGPGRDTSGYHTTNTAFEVPCGACYSWAVSCSEVLACRTCSKGR